MIDQAMQIYVVLYDGKGGKVGGYDCKNPIDGLRCLPISGNSFTFKAAACFAWQSDQLPVRQWYLDIEGHE